MKKKKIIKKDAFYKYDIDMIPSIRKSKFACYDNKKLKNWNEDDFAEYIFDHSDSKGVFNPAGTFLENYEEMIRKINSVPENYKRVFYYGVFVCFKDLHIKRNTKNESK
jgi:hypothetical protein